MPYVLIFVIGMTWTVRIGGPNSNLDEERVNLQGEMRQEFSTLKACNRALDAVSITMRNRGGHLYLQGVGRCEPMEGK